MFKVAEKNVGKPVSDTKFSDDNAVDAVNFKDESWRKSSSRVNGVNVNTQAKAVKWKKEEKPVQKYFYKESVNYKSNVVFIIFPSSSSLTTEETSDRVSTSVVTVSLSPLLSIVSVVSCIC